MWENEAIDENVYHGRWCEHLEVATDTIDYPSIVHSPS